MANPATSEERKHNQGSTSGTSGARRIFRFMRKAVKYISLLLLLLLLGIAGAGYWLTQTESGQNWLVATLNSALADPASGAAIELSNLHGSIPANFQFALKISDSKGVWLNAPQNQFSWDIAALPGKIHIRKIEAANMDVQRFPDSPPDQEPEKPAAPLTPEDINNYLHQAHAFLLEKHWWLPAIQVDEISASALLPENMLPATENAPQRLFTQANLTAKFIDNQLAIGARLNADRNDKKALELPHAKIDNMNVNASLAMQPDSKGIEIKGDVNGFLENPALQLAGLPEDFLGSSSQFGLGFTGNIYTTANMPALELSIRGPDLNAGHLQAKGAGKLQIEQNWAEKGPNGPLNYSFDFNLLPLETQKSDNNSLLAMLKSPLNFGIAAKGDLPELNLQAGLACSHIEYSGVNITNTHLDLTTEKLIIPLAGSGDILNLDQENKLNLKLASLVDKNPVSLATLLFFQKLPGSKDSIRVGLRDLAMDALQASLKGQIVAHLAGQEKPALDGNLDLSVNNFAEFEKFLPGKTLKGSAHLEARLNSGLPAVLANPGGEAAPPGAYEPAHQDAEIQFSIPSFSMGDGNPVAALRNIDGKIDLEDIFQSPAIKATVKAGNIQAAGLNLDAAINANGSIKGPLQANIKTSGSINANLTAEWEPGLAKLDTLNVQANIAPFLDKGSKKTRMVGIRSLAPAKISYGDAGIQIQNLDVQLLPAGKLQASGGFAPDKLDLKFELAGLNLKQWQAIIPQLPSGDVKVRGQLNGSPSRPGGSIAVNLNKITLPSNPMPPVSLALGAKIEHGASGSNLRAKLDIDPATVKALGGTTATIQASLPLQFGADGVPSPNMNGLLEARVQWDGALGPIWNLLPIPDMRLNGRIGVNMNVSGSLQKPRLNGNATITSGRFEDLMLGILLTDINLKLDLENAGKTGGAKGPLDSLPGSVKLALNVSDGRGGSIKANGSGALDGSKLELQTTIDRLKPLRRRDIHIDLSGNIKVNGSALNPQVNGEIIVNQGEVLLNNLEMVGSVTTLPISNASAAKKINTSFTPPVKKESGNLNVRLLMAPRFTIDGRGLTSLWKANMLLTGPLEHPQILGQIDCVRGNFDFLGKVFALTKGVVFFGGGSISDPLVDIDLTHEADDLTAHILVTGPVNKIKITINSEPTVPRDEIISRVLFGRSVNDLSRMEMLQLAGAVAQLAGFGGGTTLLGKAKKALGVDVLRIGSSDSTSSNQSNEDTGGGTTLEMGKYINDYIYMGVQQGLDADSTAFILELELSPRSSLEIKTEQNNTWGGFRWKMNY